MLTKSIKYFNTAGSSSSEFPGYRLVYPSVGVGNVGQLAVDLLIENLDPKPEKIGRIFHPALEPVVGAIGNGAESLITACEIFQHEGTKTVILQFRSPVTKRNREDFIEFFINWIQTCQFHEVLCLGSSLGSLRNDVQINEPTARYFPGINLSSVTLQGIEKANLKVLESYDPANLSALHIPGSGIAKDLFIACQTNGIPCLSLIYFASDGDNTPEAIELYGIVNQIFGFVQSPNNLELRIPKSWDFARDIDGTAPYGIF